jgi:hypothetical protein
MHKHYMGRATIHAFAAPGAFISVNDINSILLRDCFCRTKAGTSTALVTDTGLKFAGLGEFGVNHQGGFFDIYFFEMV